MGLRMSCGLSVKNKEEHPDHTRISKNLGMILSLSASEPFTFRCEIWISCNAFCTGNAKLFFFSASLMLLTSPLAIADATRPLAIRFSRSCLLPLLNTFFWNVSGAQSFWSHGSNVHANITSCFPVATFDFEQDAGNGP